MAGRANPRRSIWFVSGVLLVASCGENAGDDLVEGVDTTVETTDPTATTEPAPSTSSPVTVPRSTADTTVPSRVTSTSSPTLTTSPATDAATTSTDPTTTDPTTTFPRTATSVPVPVGTGELRLTLGALPDDQAAASVRLVRDGVDQLDDYCTVDPSAIWVTGVAYDCRNMPAGDYRIVAPAFGDVQPVTRCRIGNAWEPSPEPSVAPVGGPTVWCFVAAFPLGLRVSLWTNTFSPSLDGSYEPDGRIEPADVIVRTPDGAAVDVSCTSLTVDGEEWADCSPLPAGRYEVFYPPTPDGERPVVCAQGLDLSNGPGLGRTVDLNLGLTELGVANVYWTCHNDVPSDDLKARMQIVVEGPPDDVLDVVPELLLNGVDAFPDHCSLSAEYQSWEGGVTYFCERLEQTVYELRAPGLHGRQPTFSCLGVGIYDDWLARPDLSVDQFAYCRIDATPPGIRLAFVDVEPDRAPTIADQVRILDDAGAEVDVDCVGTSEEFEAWVHCFPMELGRYTVPVQVIDDRAVDPFICNPDIGLGWGPDSSGEVVLSDAPEPHGIDPLHWTCHNHPTY